MQTECKLCNKGSVASGRDELLFEDDFCYIVNNGTTELFSGTLTGVYSRRISLVLNEHVAKLSKTIERKAVNILTEYVHKTLHISRDSFFVIKTMNAHPNHFHIHAYILPKMKNVGET